MIDGHHSLKESLGTVGIVTEDEDGSVDGQFSDSTGSHFGPMSSCARLDGAHCDDVMNNASEH